MISPQQPRAARCHGGLQAGQLSEVIVRLPWFSHDPCGGHKVFCGVKNGIIDVINRMIKSYLFRLLGISWWFSPENGQRFIQNGLLWYDFCSDSPSYFLVANHLLIWMFSIIWALRCYSTVTLVETNSTKKSQKQSLCLLDVPEAGLNFWFEIGCTQPLERFKFTASAVSWAIVEIIWNQLAHNAVPVA